MPTTDAHVEIELKLTLDSRSDYDSVRSWLDQHCAPPLARRQTNLYLETNDGALAAHKAMARIRIDDDVVVATLKMRPSLVDGLMQSTELEFPLDLSSAARWRGQGGPSPSSIEMTDLPAPISAALTQLLASDVSWAAPALPGGAAPQRRLFVLGGLVNERRTYALPRSALSDAGVDRADGQGASPAALQIDLDATDGPAGDCRYELEFEDPAAAALRAALEAKLWQLGVAFRPSECSKYVYFLRGLSAAERRWRAGDDEATQP